MKQPAILWASQNLLSCIFLCMQKCDFRNLPLRTPASTLNINYTSLCFWFWSSLPAWLQAAKSNDSTLQSLNKTTGGWVYLSHFYTPQNPAVCSYADLLTAWVAFEKKDTECAVSAYKIWAVSVTGILNCQFTSQHCFRYSLSPCPPVGGFIFTSIIFLKCCFFFFLHWDPTLTFYILKTFLLHNWYAW